MSSLPEIDQVGAGIDRIGHSKETTFRALSKRTGIPISSLWFRKYGRPPKKKSTRDRQYLTKHEEEVLVKCFLSTAKSGNYLPYSFLPQIAQYIKRQRNSTLCTLQNSLERHSVKAPAHNWRTAFRKRHPDLEHIWTRSRSARSNNIDMWLELVGEEFNGTKVLAENTYRAIVTGFFREFPGIMRSIINKDEMRAQLQADDKTKFITAVECTSADGQFLNPLIVWPTQFQKSQEASSTLDWCHKQSKNGFLDRDIIFQWVTGTFAPQTKTRANGRRRLLISDVLFDYNTPLLTTFCEKENIRLCQLHSLDVRQLQSFHADPFGNLQTTLRKEFEQVYSQCSNSEKILFALSYNRARHNAFEEELARAKIEIQNTANKSTESSTQVKHARVQVLDNNPETAEELIILCKDIEHDLDSLVLNETVRGRIFRLLGAAEASFAKRASPVERTGSM